MQTVTGVCVVVVSVRDPSGFVTVFVDVEGVPFVTESGAVFLLTHVVTPPTVTGAPPAPMHLDSSVDVEVPLVPLIDGAEVPEQRPPVVDMV